MNDSQSQSEYMYAFCYLCITAFSYMLLRNSPWSVAALSASAMVGSVVITVIIARHEEWYKNVVRKTVGLSVIWLLLQMVDGLILMQSNVYVIIIVLSAVQFIIPQVCLMAFAYFWRVGR